MRLCLVSTSLVFALALATQAQSHLAVPPEPTGSVSGHVFCADTNQPARFAHVSLVPAPAANSDAKLMAKLQTSAANGSVETTLDGSYTIRNVKPGSYYVVADKQGYIVLNDIFTPAQLADPSPEIRALVAAATPRINVEANRTETAEISLQRGGAIAGTIRYDDGSPAGELHVSLLHKDPSGEWKPIEFSGRIGSWISTDDHGNFRFSSLLSDDYIVRAELDLADTEVSHLKNVMGGKITDMTVNFTKSRFSLPFYGSGTSLVSEAKPIALRAGIEAPGHDMTIPLSKLHKLTGHVAAGRDAHFVNAAKLTLVTRDGNKELATTDISREDGLFHFEFVPDGDYILKITEARDVTWETPAATRDNPNPQEKERTLATYGATEEAILLRGDLLGTLATVSPDAVPSPAKPAKTVNATTDSPDPKPDAAPAKPEAAPQTKSAIAAL